MKRKAGLLFIIWIAFISGMILFKNPFLFSRELLIWQSNNLLWEPVNLSHKTSVAEEEIYYRGNLQRRAVFDIPFRPRMAKRLWLNPLMNVGIHSASKASPVSDGEAIYIGGDTSWFYSLSPIGEINWSFYAGGSNFGIHSTAAIDKDSVYFGSYRGSLYRLDKRTGSLIWARTVGETVGSSPLLKDNALIVAVETLNRDGYVVKVDKTNGNLIWRSLDLGEQSHSSPAVSLDGKLIYLGANNNKFFALNDADGSIKWQILTDGKIKSTPVVFQDNVFITTWGGTLYNLNARSGNIIWKANIGFKSQASPTILSHESVVVSANGEGTLYFNDLKTGKLKTSVPLNLKRNTASPVVLKTGKLEKILVPCDEAAMCLISDKGKIELKFPLSARMTSSAFVIGDRLYVALGESGLEAFQFIQ